MAADRAQHVADRDRARARRGAMGGVRPVRAVVARVPGSRARAGRRRGRASSAAVATAGLVPDVVLVLDVSDAVADARRAEESDRLEREGAAFHAAVRAAYRELAPRARLDRDRCRRRRRRGGRARPRRGRAAPGRMTAVVATSTGRGSPGRSERWRSCSAPRRRPVHAYLLVGPRGSGVEEAARCFAAALDHHRRRRTRRGTSCCAASTPTWSRSTRRPPRSASRTRRRSSTRCRGARSRASARSSCSSTPNGCASTKPPPTSCSRRWRNRRRAR